MSKELKDRIYKMALSSLRILYVSQVEEISEEAQNL